MMLVASQTWAAGIMNTKHNLSTNAVGGVTIKSTDYDELCVFCHTPHMADTSVTNAPLWNRGVGAALATTNLYNSSSLDAASKPNFAGLVTKINNSDAPLCLSCHDGSSLAGGLKNPSNLAGGTQPAFGASNKVTGFADILDGSNSLRNDHPIGMVYNTIQGTTPTEFKTAAATTMNFYDGGVMWCSSCHDVHDDTASPFLATSNTNSGLCLSCHIK
jgi:predicted CXXCH cytochrome family protein